MQPRWTSGPRTLTLVRHGHSLGNLADAEAREAGAERLDLDARDADVELSPLGCEQADALGRWMADGGPARPPTLLVTSPYRRAAETARRAVAGLDDATRGRLDHDERLRERDLGALDGLTGTGIRARYPEEAARRGKVGKFYYQPPSGESWTDVALRVRSVLQDLRVGHDGEDVWLFTHQAVVMTFRYVLEGLTEEEVLELDRTVNVPNCSVTTYQRDGDRLRLERFADTTAVERVDVPVTAPDEQHGAAPQ
jgi:broad specificity phosphatase PhoE